MEVFLLSVQTHQDGRDMMIYPALIQDGNEYILVDAGYASDFPTIDAQLNALGLTSADLTGVILTHDDIDHVGGLAQLKSACPAIRVYASVIEAPYISGSTKSLRLIQAEQLYDQLPESHKAWALGFQERLRAIQRIPVDQELEPGHTLLPGLEIIPTPGHTPGHISLYVPASKTLIAGDALVIEGEQLNLANPQFALDLPQAVNSVRSIALLDIDRLLCYHGGEMRHSVAQQLQYLCNSDFFASFGKP
jgi:glyoxylase-like metal-dependent hydrolase (beta-lactamase superfamily II)